MMLSPEARGALRRDWLAEVEAEIARRAAAREGKDDSRRRLLGELQQMAQRFMAAARPSDVEIAGQLLQAAPDWSRVDEIRLRAGLAPAEAIAMVLAQDLTMAERMLAAYSRRHRY
jgi:hypothetical protein